MRIVGATLVSDRWVNAQFLFCLAGAEQIGGQFVRAHVVEDALAFFQSLARVDSGGSLTTIETAIAVVLEEREVLLGEHPTSYATAASCLL